MFDDLNSKKDENVPGEEGKIKKPEAPIGNLGNVPVTLSPNPSPSLASSGEPTSPKPQPVDEASEKKFDQRMQKLEEKGKKRGIRFSKIGIITVSVIALSMMAAGYYLLSDVIGIAEKTQISVGNIPNIGRDNGNGEKKEPKEKLPVLSMEMRACEVDEDCVEAQESCCTCNNGGIQTGINKNYKETWDLEINNKCDEIVCDAVVQCFIGRAYCDAMVCKFIEEEENCKSEGEIYTDMANEELSVCCGELQKVIPRSELVDGECESFSGEAICINCGDGVCGEGENQCICPEDCDLGAEIIKEATTTEEILEDCPGGICPPDVTLDTDGDGLLDIDEKAIGSDINLPDTDGDELLDGDEIIYGTDVLNPDTDGDGFTDGSEVKNGYNPLGDGMLN